MDQKNSAKDYRIPHDKPSPSNMMHAAISQKMGRSRPQKKTNNKPQLAPKAIQGIYQYQSIPSTVLRR